MGPFILARFLLCHNVSSLRLRFVLMDFMPRRLLRLFVLSFPGYLDLQGSDAGRGSSVPFAMSKGGVLEQHR